MKLQAKAAAGVRWTGLSSLSSAASDIARTVILARYLSPVDYGLMAMVSIVIGFTQMYVDLGISAALIHRQDTNKKELSSLYWLNIFFGAALCVLVYFITPVVAILFREPRVLPLLRATTLVFLIIPVGAQFEVLLQKELAFRLLARWDIAASLAGTVVAISLALTGHGVWALAWAFLTNTAVKTSLLSIVGFRQFRPSFHFALADVRGYVGFGLYQLGERSVNYLAERLDQILIAPLLGPQALGYYNLALYLTAQPLSRINPILTKVAFPVFSKLQQEPDRLRRGYLKLLNLLVTVNAPLLVGLAAVAPWAVPVVFGPKWTASIILIQILSFVALFRSIGNPIGSLQLAKGRADLGFWWNVLLFCCSVPAIYLGGRLASARGVALALLFLQIGLNVPGYVLLVRPLLGNCAADYFRITLKPIAMALVMGGAVALLPSLLPSNSVRLELISRIFAGALIYVFLLRTMHMSAITDFRRALLAR